MVASRDIFGTALESLCDSRRLSRGRRRLAQNLNAAPIYSNIRRARLGGGYRLCLQQRHVPHRPKENPSRTIDGISFTNIRKHGGKSGCVNPSIFVNVDLFEVDGCMCCVCVCVCVCEKTSLSHCLDWFIAAIVRISPYPFVWPEDRKGQETKKNFMNRFFNLLLSMKKRTTNIIIHNNSAAPSFEFP